MNPVRKYIKQSILLFLPVYLLLLANSMLNMHMHVLSNGMVVRHAHPFGHDRDQEHDQESHSHSGKEYSFYEGFYLDYCDTAEPLPVLQQLIVKEEIAGKPVSPNYRFELSALFPLRGPPTC